MSAYERGFRSMGAVLIACVCFSASAFAEEREVSRFQGSLRKLGRGIANVATCPVELFQTPKKTLRREGHIAAATIGVLEGAWRTLVRGAVGLFEIATFYAEVPPGFEPLIKPEFVLGTGADET